MADYGDGCDYSDGYSELIDCWVMLVGVLLLLGFVILVASNAPVVEGDLLQHVPELPERVERIERGE